jgi:hypothetical protein
MTTDSGNSREFKSLAEIQAAYFPGLEGADDRSKTAPRQVGARLAREVLSEVMRPAALPVTAPTGLEPQAKPKA